MPIKRMVSDMSIFKLGRDLPLVTLTLVRGTTALEVNAPPVHYLELGLVCIHYCL